MDEVSELKKKASELRKIGQFSDAQILYQTLWAHHRDECNEWDGWGFATCLRKLGDSEKALEICRNVYQTNPDFENGKNLYAWCIYDTEIKKDDDQIKRAEKTFFKASKAILKLTMQTQYSPYTKTVFRVIDYIIKGSASYPTNDILHWVDKLDPNSLSKESFSFMGEDQKHRELQSDQEKWFAIKTKALEKDGAHEKCMELCEEALKNIAKFHYNNDIWFKRRIALSKANLGNKQQAAEELETLLHKKKEWFIQNELAHIYYDLGNEKEALGFAIEAALNFGKHENKWELFLLLARILLKQGRIVEARRHLAFVAKLRIENGWKITEPLSKMLTESNIDLSELPEKHVLLKYLKRFWETERSSSLPCMQGFVKTILKNGKAGFISGDDKKDYFFKVRGFEGDRKKLRIGLKVKFNLEDSFDRKRNRKTKAATNIREIIQSPIN